MGMQIFEKSGVFDPAMWGLKAGDVVQVVVVGGGNGGMKGYDAGAEAGKGAGHGGGGGGGGYGGGGGGGCGNSNTKGGKGGNAGQIVFATIALPNTASIPVTIGAAGEANGGTGGTSSFGTYATAIGGGGAAGGLGSSSTGESPAGGGGGGGGYLPGLPVWGGSGGNGSTIVTGAGVIVHPAELNGALLGGGAGYTRHDTTVSSIMYKNYTCGGTSPYGGNAGQDGGPGHGVVVVTW